MRLFSLLRQRRNALTAIDAGNWKELAQTNGYLWAYAPAATYWQYHLSSCRVSTRRSAQQPVPRTCAGLVDILGGEGHLSLDGEMVPEAKTQTTWGVELQSVARTTSSEGGSNVAITFNRDESRAVFLGMYGSYVGNWAATDNLLRAALANRGFGLAARSRLCDTFFHHMGLGANISCKCAHRMLTSSRTTLPAAGLSVNDGVFLAHGRPIASLTLSGLPRSST
jgi:hypothetical protein